MSSGKDQTAESIAAFVREHAGSRLPGERQLAERFGISRPRLRIALRELAAAGLVESRQGSGTYAVDPNVQRLRSIALLVDEQVKLGSDPFFSHLFDNIQRACQAMRLECRMRRIGESATPAAALCDGAITIGNAGRSIVRDHAAGGVPIVAIMPGSPVRPSGRISVFQLDDLQAGRAAAALLISEGCRRIVFVGRLDIDASRERYQGLAEACEASGVDVGVVECHLNYLAGLESGRRLADEESPEIGLVAMNDWLAVGVRGGLNARGAATGHAIVSFDGLAVASEPSLRIRSLRVPVELIADDTVAELSRLHSLRGSAGRMLTYALQLAESK